MMVVKNQVKGASGSSCFRNDRICDLPHGPLGFVCKANTSCVLRSQVLRPTTLVGTELKPPVGHAKDWMWNGDTVVQTLTRLLGPAGATVDLAWQHHVLLQRRRAKLVSIACCWCAAQQVSISASEFPRFPEKPEEAHARYSQAFEVNAPQHRVFLTAFL